ncbi:tocopherol cyclase, chloroplastic-like isoform X2 [Zingiber officinale]|uniref:tocopherol cyclase, chloroplastic-like isoform X2 n=1 Tax=Zingiber officinale TaxID=94328 RepID=UPI001C4C512C|nr:tocopherol cyclase, chloroplastic-like isoform X2 [Zingiber officinale]
MFQNGLVQFPYVGRAAVLKPNIDLNDERFISKERATRFSSISVIGSVLAFPEGDPMDAASSAALICRSSFPAVSATPDRRPAALPRAGILPFSYRRPFSVNGLKCRAASRDVEPVSADSEGEDGAPASAVPVYTPTPPNRELRTPHSGHELMLGNTFLLGKGSAPTGEVQPQEFRERVLEGFQVSPLWHQGFIRDDGRSNYVETVKTARWEYNTRPVYGWGDVNSKQKSTAGWLAAFPVFEPHWQICMASGLSTGWIEWDGKRFEFENAPSYSEKNWGGGFPRKWFWVQCNVFKGASGEVALTAAGGLRKLPGFTENFENAALVGVHYGGSFYEFVPWNGTVRWDVAKWGFWHMSAENNTHMVELQATTTDPGIPLRAPTTEAGLDVVCKDTCFGDLKLQLWERKFDGSKGKLILDVTSNMAAVEVGGGPWFSNWKGTTSSPELISRALAVNVDVESFFPLPFLKPPGL